MFRSKGWLAFAMTAAVLTASCSEVQLAAHTAKRMGSGSAGGYKVGTPYQIAGKWYHPAVDYGYEETGIASWYGPNFHGKTTANGETFDKYDLTAAHRTLPMPSIVKVTNLENGRALRLRINDRGPFARGRIIDISERGAELLGFKVKGTARVRVRILADESRAIAERAKRGEKPARMTQRKAPVAPRSAVVAKAPRPAPVTAQSLNGAVTTEPVRNTGIYIQAGAYSNPANAGRAETRLGAIGPVEVAPISVRGRDLYRVRVGPIASVSQADGYLDKVIRAGYDDARIVVISVD